MSNAADRPLGAAENGTAFLDRLEHDYRFDCEAGPLQLCSDWIELRRCFDVLADFVRHVDLTRAAKAEAEVARLTAELAQVKGLLEEAREWNWIDFEEAKKAGDEVEAFLPDLCRLDAEITAALAQPADDLHGEER